MSYVKKTKLSQDELDSWKEKSRTTVGVLPLIDDLQEVQKFRCYTVNTQVTA